MGKRNVGRRAFTYLDTLKMDTGLDTAKELKTAMEDRSGWKQRVSLTRVTNQGINNEYVVDRASFSADKATYLKPP